MNLSRKAKEATKTALAITIAYGIALGMGWDRPYWAGFAVAFISLSTYGQSLNKAALRMAGTGMGIVMAFVLIALFSQERWLFMVGVSIWVGLCTYMMGGSQRAYFWNVAGLVCVIVCMDAGPSSTNAFSVAMLRAQETGLGILVYSLVASLLWPTRSGAQFAAAVNEFVAAQASLYEGCRDRVLGQSTAAQTHELSAQLRQARDRFQTLLAAADTDTYEVWALRAQWQTFQRQALALTISLARWRDTLEGIQDIDLAKVFPDLQELDDLLGQRFKGMAAMLANEPPAGDSAPLELAVDRAGFRALSAFERAEVTAARARWQEIEQLTRGLLAAIADIRDFNRIAVDSTPADSSPAPFFLDTDRLLSVFRVLLILWLAYLLWIYVPDLPGGTGVVSMACPLGMALASMPQVRVSKMFRPAMLSTLAASIIYIFIMPQLSSFLGLGTLLFISTFAIYYLFATPQQALGRVFGIAMFLSIASISNEQSYSFMVVASTAMMLPIVFLVLLVTAYIPFSPLPEKAFERLLRRYFRSSEYLLSTLGDWQQPLGSREHARQARQLREIATLPQKLAAWSRAIGPGLLPGGSPAATQQLVADLQALSFRIQELLSARDHQYPPSLIAALQADIRAWRLAIQQVFQRLSVDPSDLDRQAFQAGLAATIDHMEQQVRAALDQPEQGRISDEEGADFFQLLAAYRGVSVALGDYAGSVAPIDWPGWREERFA